jgi:hypothetical protein
VIQSGDTGSGEMVSSSITPLLTRVRVKCARLWAIGAPSLDGALAIYPRAAPSAKRDRRR